LFSLERVKPRVTIEELSDPENRQSQSHPLLHPGSIVPGAELSARRYPGVRGGG
jgi:hypothetical protein